MCMRLNRAGGLEACRMAQNTAVNRWRIKSLKYVREKRVARNSHFIERRGLDVLVSHALQMETKCHMHTHTHTSKRKLESYQDPRITTRKQYSVLPIKSASEGPHTTLRGRLA